MTTKEISVNKGASRSYYINCIYQPIFNISLTSFRVSLPIYVAKDDSSNVFMNAGRLASMEQ